MAYRDRSAGCIADAGAESDFTELLDEPLGAHPLGRAERALGRGRAEATQCGNSFDCRFIPAVDMAKDRSDVRSDIGWLWPPASPAHSSRCQAMVSLLAHVILRTPPIAQWKR